MVSLPSSRPSAHAGIRDGQEASGGWRYAAARLIGVGLLASGITVIWYCRIVIGRNVYVSGLGADGEPTAQLFNLGLLVIGIGGVLVAAGTRGRGMVPRARLPFLGWWSISATLAVAGTLFIVSSQVPCTYACPVPFTEGSTIQDLVHTVAAVLGFAAAGFALLQTAAQSVLPQCRGTALVSGIAIILVAGTGGLLSLFQFATTVGGWLELVATTIAIGWLISYALAGGLTDEKGDGGGGPERPPTRALVEVQ